MHIEYFANLAYENCARLKGDTKAVNVCVCGWVSVTHTSVCNCVCVRLVCVFILLANLITILQSDKVGQHSKLASNLIVVVWRCH